MEKKIIKIGVIDCNGYELDNRVYDRGVLPTIKAGNARIHIIRKVKTDKNDR